MLTENLFSSSGTVTSSDCIGVREQSRDFRKQPGASLPAENSQEGTSLLTENSQEGTSLLTENSQEGTSLPPKEVYDV